MAGTGKKSTTKKAKLDTHVTRITASDTEAVAKKDTEVIKKPIKKAAKPQKSDERTKNPLIAISRYFAGAWYELKQVRWPTRQATWSMTAAMLVFTGFFVLLILLLDALFKYLFELILG